MQYTESRESVKYRTQQISRIIVNVKESCQVVEELLQAGQPIGFDGEGVNLGPKGKLRSCIHCSSFPIPSRDVTNQTLPGGE